MCVCVCVWLFLIVVSRDLFVGLFLYGSARTIYDWIKFTNRVIFFMCVVWFSCQYFLLSIICVQITKSSDYIFMHTCVVHWASFQKFLFFSQTFNIGNVHQDECQAGQLTCQVWKNEYSYTTSQVEEEEEHNLHFTPSTEQRLRSNVVSYEAG